MIPFPLRHFTVEETMPESYSEDNAGNRALKQYPGIRIIDGDWYVLATRRVQRNERNGVVVVTVTYREMTNRELGYVYRLYSVIHEYEEEEEQRQNPTQRILHSLFTHFIQI